MEEKDKLNLIANEKKLDLVVKEKTLGTLVTNAKEIKEFTAEKLKEYSIENYQGDEKQAAKDKAELNNAAKKLNDERIALEKEWTQPFQEFKEVVTETISMIKAASSALDNIVKEKIEKEKQEKKEEITQLWEKQNFTLVSLNRIFNTRWLNKTYKITNVEKDIQEIIAGIQKDLEVLGSFQDDAEILKDIYLTTLDLQKTMQKGNELKANRQKRELERERELEEQKKKQELNERPTDIDSVMKIGKEGVSAADAGIEVKEDAQEETFLKLGPETFIFHTFGTAKEMAVVMDIAKVIGLNIVPSLTFSGTAKQIGDFREAVAKMGVVYKKQDNASLFIETVEKGSNHDAA